LEYQLIDWIRKGLPVTFTPPALGASEGPRGKGPSLPLTTGRFCVPLPLYGVPRQAQAEGVEAINVEEI